MRRDDGIALLAAAIFGLALALIAATMFEFAKQACYARHNVIAPLVGCTAMVVFALVGAPLSAALLSGPAVLLGLGVTVTLGELTRALVCDRAACRDTHSAKHARTRSLARHLTTALATIGPGAIAARVIEHALPGHLGAIAGVVAGVGVGLAAYVAVQALLGAPELPPNRLSARRELARDRNRPA
jgi:peptidoglycan biosynthesis protein MviN/MurJ (putative lipid II flippase)